MCDLAGMAAARLWRAASVDCANYSLLSPAGSSLQPEGQTDTIDTAAYWMLQDKLKLKANQIAGGLQRINTNGA